MTTMGWEQRFAQTLQPALRLSSELRQSSDASDASRARDVSPKGGIVLPESMLRRSTTWTPGFFSAKRPDKAGPEGSPPPELHEARWRTALLTWGLNSSGQLGFGDFSTRILPRAVEYFKATKLARVICGSRTTFVLDADGKVFAWGKGEDGTLGIGDRATAMTPRLVETLLRQPIAQMKCRGAHVLALTTEGKLWAWGRDEDGQLGNERTSAGPRAHHNALPERVAGLMGTRIRHIACGRCHSIAVDTDGRMHSWGGNDDGALGHGDRVSRSSPTLCAALDGMLVVGVACGSRHTLALVRAGEQSVRGLFHDLEREASAPGTPPPGTPDAPGMAGTLYSWGWGVYGQLGHGDIANRLVPTEVAALADTPVRQLACGYRHSMVVTATEPRRVYAWGWGHDGQLGTGVLRDQLTPQLVSGLPASGAIELRLGGRHSLALCEGGRVFAWGKDDDGQLGLGVQSRAVPTRIEALHSSSVHFDVLDANCGWAHTALLVAFREATDAKPGRASRRPSLAQLAKQSSLSSVLLGALGLQPAAHGRYPRGFGSGDLEGLFGQVMGTSIQFMLMQRVLLTNCGFGHELLDEQLLPGATATYVLGHVFFAVQGTLLSRRTRQPVTALPQGINVVTFFAWSSLIMGPAYRNALNDGVPPAVASRHSYDVGLCACLLLAALELVGVLFVETLRKVIPRAAMLSAIAGVSLTFMAMGFAVQIFAAPATAIVSMLLMLLFYAGRVKLPFKVPGGVVAVFCGWALATISRERGYDWFTPDGKSFELAEPRLLLPTVQWRFVYTFLQPEFWRCISVVIPMWMVTLVNNLSNIQSASSVGDEYSPRQCLLGCALIDLSCCFLGNPFPSCVYIGHPAFKAMGCRVGYLYLNILPTIFFGCMQGAGLLGQMIPIESGVGFLLVIGLSITASGFEGDHTPEGWRHGPAVALGLLPSIAAWSWQVVVTTFTATQTLYCDAMGAAAAHATPECSLELHEIFQAASAPPAKADSLIGAFQRNVFNLFLSGMFALANGYLLTALSLSSMLVHIIDGQYHKASVWLVLCAAFSSVGIIHSRTLDPYEANQLFPIMYLIAAALLLLCHAIQNRAEQIRELQVQWQLALVELAERFPTALAPVQGAIDRLADRLGLPTKPSSKPSSSRPSRASGEGAHDGDGAREPRCAHDSSADESARDSPEQGAEHGAGTPDKRPSGEPSVPASRSRTRLFHSLGVDWLDESLPPTPHRDAKAEPLLGDAQRV